MFNIGGSDADTFIMKYTLIAGFLIVTLVFGGKIVILLGDVIMMKLQVFQDFMTSPEAMKKIGAWLWEAITSGRGE